MGKAVISEEIFPEIIERYNTEGKAAAYDLIRSKYGLKQPYFVMTRIKKSGRYFYNPETDQFSCVQQNAADNVFMDLDELCGPAIDKPYKQAKAAADIRPLALEKLIHELISDRLLTLSRYITMDMSTKTILIDQSSLSADGYHIITH